VRPIAKRFVGALATSAKTDHRPTGQSEFIATRVINFDVAFYPQRTVIVDGNFGWHLVDSFSGKLSQTGLLPAQKRGKFGAARQSVWQPDKNHM
jgi:hypothetical protein